MSTDVSSALPAARAHRSRSVRAGIYTYLACTFALSSIFYVLIIRAGHLMAGKGLYVLALMWCPGVAAIITCLIRGKPLSSLGWRWTWRYQLMSYAIPIAYAGIAYVLVWITGLGGFPNWKVVDAFATRVGLTHVNHVVMLALFIVFTGTVGMFGATVSAVSEEIGWRGFLVPELAKVTSFTRTALISGAIWTAWHDEFGCALALVAVLVAVLVWRRRDEVPSDSDDARRELVSDGAGRRAGMIAAGA